MPSGYYRFAFLLVTAAAPLALAAQTSGSTAAAAGYSAAQCADCAAWNAPHAPLRLFGDTYFVGTAGLSALLVTSPAGHVLIDAGLPESAPRIRENVRALGFRLEDVKLIVTSHAHFDHAGGVAELQRASGATVAASPWSARVMTTGAPAPEDPQYRVALRYPAVANVQVIADGDTLRVGPLALVAHFTPGHTPGGTSWTWRACEGARCLDVVYADSQTPVSADGFLFTRSAAYPTAVAAVARAAEHRAEEVLQVAGDVQHERATHVGQPRALRPRARVVRIRLDHPSRGAQLAQHHRAHRPRERRRVDGGRCIGSPRVHRLPSRWWHDPQRDARSRSRRRASCARAPAA